MRTISLLLLMSFALLASAFGEARVLFVRGGSGTGGFLEGGNDDQLADIGDYSTRGGNHGWGELADWLRDHGFELEQVSEGPKNNNQPVPFADMALSVYDVIVLGSNNADYEARHVDAVENWIKAGGGLLVISDANFGQSWGDAPSSDQAFFDRLGWVMNQDQGTYTLNRNQDFLVADHPILDNISSFDGEGVSPIMVAETIPNIQTTILVKAKGTTRRNNRDSQGSSRQTTEADGSLVIAEVEAGRVVGHFDRNTFFNQNGAGTSLHRFSNRTYALNLFRWLAYGEGNLELRIEHPSKSTITLTSSKEEVRFLVEASLFGEVLGIFHGVNYQWSLVEGDGTTTFSREASNTTNARFSAPGRYRIQVHASHEGREATEEFEVTVMFRTSDLIAEAFGSSAPRGEIRWVEVNGTPQLQLTYPRLTQSPLTFTLETSSDLETWNPSEATPDLTEDGILRFLAAPTSVDSYLRVRVE